MVVWQVIVSCPYTVLLFWHVRCTSGPRRSWCTSTTRVLCATCTVLGSFALQTTHLHKTVSRLMVLCETGLLSKTGLSVSLFMSRSETASYEGGGRGERASSILISPTKPWVQIFPQYLFVNMRPWRRLFSRCNLFGTWNFDRKKQTPPRVVSYLLCSLIKNRV